MGKNTPQMNQSSELANNNNKKPFYKNRKFWKRAGILAGITAGLATVYTLAVEVWLRDLSNLTYIRFSYRADPGLSINQQEVTITKVLYNTDYPTNFAIPSKILGRPVTTIGEEAFAGLERLKRVEMPDSVTTIEDRAFYNCGNLTSFEFSESIEYIGVDAFSNTAFYDDFDDGFLYVGRTLYSYKGLMPEGTALVPYGDKDNPEYSDYTNIIEFDDQLETLSPGLFANQPGLESVYLPEGVTSIDREVFANNANLTKVELPEGLLEVKTKAFYNTPMLTDVLLPATVTSLGDEAFKNSGIGGDIVIPDGISSLGISTFENTPNITSVSVNDGLLSIGDYAFRNSTSLASIDIDHQSALTSIGREAFAGTAITEFIVPKGVSTVLSGLLRDTPNLESVYLSDPYDRPDSIFDGGVTSIRDYAFYNTPALKTIATYDSTQAEFTLTSPLNEVNFPSSVKDLGIQRNTGYIFAQSGIEKITIPDAVTLIPTNMFENATSLANVTFSANSALSEVKQAAFKGATSLTGITLPETVRTIGYSAFQNSGLIQFVFPTNMTTINESTFENADSLVNVTLPPNLKTIKSKSFYDCDALVSINVPPTVTHLYEYSFGNCDNLIDINFQAGMELELWNYAFANSNLLTTATIPAGVTEIALGAFKDSENITSIDWSLAPNVTRINDFAFQNNSSLAVIDIPDSITSIGKDAFTGTAWYDAQPDGYVVLDHVLYRYKGALPTNGIIEIPAGVRVINEYAFTNARGQINEVIFPDSVEVIGKHAFSNVNTVLTQAEITAGLTGLGPSTLTFTPTSNLQLIDDNAFANASALTSLTLPDTVKTIGAYAFTHNLKLQTLEIAKNSQLEEIKTNAFYDTPALTGNLYIPLNAKIGNYAFGSATGNTGLTIHIANPYADSFNTKIYDSNWNPHNIAVQWGSVHP